MTAKLKAKLNLITIIDPLDELARCHHPRLDPGWLDAIIHPLETRTWISMGIEAASQSPATREFNMGVLQT